MRTHFPSNAREREDAANLHVLIAAVRISLAEQDSVNAHFHDELGRALHSAAISARAEFDGIPAVEYGPDWLALFDATTAGTAHELHVWLGKKLSNTPASLSPMFAEILASLEARRSEADFGFEANLRNLRELFNLDEVECQLLELAAAVKLSSNGLSCLDIGKPVSRVYRAFASATASTANAVRDALVRDGRLYRAGLMQSSLGDEPSFDQALRLSAFGKQLFAHPHVTAEDLFGAILEPLIPSAAPHSRWPGVGAEEPTVHAILETALAQHRAGVNILLVGDARSGKTEFSRHLARSLSCEAYRVQCKDNEGNDAPRSCRLAALQAAGPLLGASAQALIVFDEADGVFPDPSREHRRITVPGAIGSKAWFDTALASNIHPTIWIVNEADGIDLALFTFCLRFDTPPIQVRRQIAEDILAPAGVSDAVITAVSQRSEFSQKLVMQCARVVGLAGGKAGAHDHVAMTYLDSHAKVMQLPTCGQLPQPATRFDTGYLHLGGGFTAAQIIDAIARNGAGTVLMNGPPGTGKTQLARQIAHALGRELLYFTASDINTKWFGESERNVARIFSQCDPTSQVIFLDEAETVLGAREEAAHRASESVTAEFLRQLEPFTGVFLCATNHADRLDSALVRRFTFRLEFKPLTLAQRTRMLAELLSEPALPLSCLKALEGLDGLTPGDFANVRKRFAMLGCEASAVDWLAELTLEWRAKSHHVSNTRIGFV